MAPSTEGPMHDRMLYRLTWLAAALSLGHHLDHLILRQRGRLAANREGQRLRRPPSRLILGSQLVIAMTDKRSQCRRSTQ